MLDALKAIDTWRRAPALALLGETDGHWDELSRLAAEGRITGPRFHDTRIAALCIEHGVGELWTADRDFSRHPRLKTCNPLVRPA